MKNLYSTPGRNCQKGFLLSFAASVLMFLSTIGTIQALPDLTVRYANPHYDCTTNIYCVDVEFQCSEPQRRLFGMNIRIIYDADVLEYHSTDQFATGYGLTGSPNISIGGPGSGSGFFGFKGPLVYFNGTMQLLNPFSSPVFISTDNWTKLYRLCFMVLDEDAFEDNAFSPSLVWEKQEDPSAGGFFGGSGGVIMTLVDAGNPFTSNPTNENVIQFNWAYSQDGGIAFGFPVATDVLTLPPSDCTGMDMVANIDELPFLLEGATPLGGSYSGSGVSGNVFHPQMAGVGNHKIRYEYMNEDTGCPMICFFDIVVFDVPLVIGQVKYFNDEQTPLNDITISLKDSSGNIIAITTSGDYLPNPDDLATLIPGYFSFPYVPDGEYSISASAGLPWYGANATDALVVQLYIVGNLPDHFIWDPVLSSRAADVNLSNTITSLDALQIHRRMLGQISGFQAGDWVFNNPSFMVEGPTQINVLALNTGDVNRSNIPGQTKSESGIQIKNSGDVLVQTNDIIYLPLTVKNPVELGAITLDINYRYDLIEIVESDFELENLNRSRGSIALAWSSEIPRNLLASDALVTLKIRVLDRIPANTRLFELGVNNELADAKARVLKNAILEVPSLISVESEEKELLLANLPNPFHDYTRILYTLPASGNVSLVVYDQTGKVLQTLVNTFQQAGVYEVEFRQPGLKPGVYPYRIILDQGASAISTSQTMIYISNE